MATSTIEQYLPLTAAYINWVFDNDSKTRGGHHNYVVEQNCINTAIPLSEKTKSQLAEYDAQQLAYIRGLDQNPDCVLIVSESTFEDCAEIVDIFGQGCNYPTKKGVNGYQVDFDVLAFKDGQSREFHIVFQSHERSDNLRSYSGFEMTTAAKYGCDADESTELEEFMDYQDDIFDDLESRAVSLCKKWFRVNYED